MPGRSPQVRRSGWRRPCRQVCPLPGVPVIVEEGSEVRGRGGGWSGGTYGPMGPEGSEGLEGLEGPVTTTVLRLSVALLNLAKWMPVSVSVPSWSGPAINDRHRAVSVSGDGRTRPCAPEKIGRVLAAAAIENIVAPSAGEIVVAVAAVELVPFPPRPTACRCRRRR